MKKTWLSLLCLLLTFVMLFSFAGCKKKTEPDDQDVAQDKPSVETDDEKGPYSVTEHYLPEKLMASMVKGFEKNDKSYYYAATADQAPYAIMDVYTLSDCRVKSLTVPVFKTLNTDADGNFIFTIFIGSNTWEGLQGSAARTIPVKVNAKEHDLTANNQSAYKYVTIDLSGYEVTLAEGETMAFFAATDTLVPGLLSSSQSETGEIFRTQWGVSDTFIRVFQNARWSQLTNASSTDHDGLTHRTLIMDFELERTWESKAAYNKEMAEIEAEEKEFQRKLAAVQDYWRGKNISLMGDSISTFREVTANTSIRASLIANRSYYSAGGVFKDYTSVYWGTVASELEMNLCVIDGWSSSRTYGGGSDKDNNVNPDADNMLVRADKLHRDNGMQPDLIIINMGINDVNHTATWGDFYNLIDGAPDVHAAVDEWFQGVLATKAQADIATDGVVKSGVTYESWQAAYALGLQKMKATYPNADIYCMTFNPSHHTSGENGKSSRGGECIRALAEYFGVKVIDQEKYGHITQENCHIYGYDTTVTALHPNLRGHQMMARCIIEELYKGLPTE